MATRLQAQPGDRFGQWTLVEEVERKVFPSGEKRRRARVRCDCGSLCIRDLSSLTSGKSRSCKSCSTIKHGKANTPEYHAWHSMLQRCNDPKSRPYKNYGGRGIRVCARWDPAQGGSFENFYADLGPRPASHYHLDKEAFDLGAKEYKPQTTQWVPRQKNLNRKRTTRFITYRDKTQSLSEWARELGIGRVTITHRLQKGWSIDAAFTTPVGSDYKR